jgi:hypothetical protein
LHEVNCELVMIILESVFYWIIAIAPPHPGWVTLHYENVV